MSGPAHVKRVRALHQRKFREEQDLFLVQGRKMVAELLGAGWKVKELYATAEAAQAEGLGQAEIVPAKDLERMGTFRQGNEVVAVVRKPRTPELALPGPSGFVLALDRVGDPGNMGTLLRIADWFGAEQVWCTPGSVEVWNPKCVQASMGSIFRMPVAHADLAAALHRASGHGVQVFKAVLGGEDVFTVPLSRPAVLVMGSESHGLSEAVLAAPGRSVSIPSFGGAESLNVSAAAAALCMEMARQHTG